MSLNSRRAKMLAVVQQANQSARTVGTDPSLRIPDSAARIQSVGYHPGIRKPEKCIKGQDTYWRGSMYCRPGSAALTPAWDRTRSEIS